MPNWVYNELTIEKLNDESLSTEEILSQICSTEENGEKTFDFNKIIPMPESLGIEDGSKTLGAMRIYLYYHMGYFSIEQLETIRNRMESWWVEKFNKDSGLTIQDLVEDLTAYDNVTLDELMRLGEVAVNNLLTYGSYAWYGWCCNNWGTKWNACQTMINDNLIYFETAWSPPMPVIEQLSRMFPNNKFTFTYAEEQLSEYAGKGVFINGELSFEDYSNDSKKCFETAFRLLGCEPQDYGYEYDEELGTYKYINDSED